MSALGTIAAGAAAAQQVIIEAFKRFGKKSDNVTSLGGGKTSSAENTSLAGLSTKKFNGFSVLGTGKVKDSNNPSFQAIIEAGLNRGAETLGKVRGKVPVQAETPTKTTSNINVMSQNARD